MTKAHPDRIFNTNPGSRIFTLDVIRGFAVLGILLMNILSGVTDLYAEGAIHFFSINPGDYYTWFITDITVNGKMRCLFSMLFGAGILLFLSKQREGVSATMAYYRRMVALLLFGLFDLVIIMWQGDILYAYALCGMLLFFCRKLKPVWLLLLGIIGIGAITWQANRNFARTKDTREKFLVADQMLKEGKNPSAELDSAYVKWKKKEKHLYPFSDSVKKEISGYIQEEIVAHRQPWPEAFVTQAGDVAEGLTEPDPYFDAFEALTAMLIGMALFKWNFFSGRYSLRKYWTIALTCLVVGLPIAYAITHGPRSHAAHNYPAYLDKYPFDLEALEQVPRVLLAVFYACLLIIICKMHVFQRLTNWLASVGRMAFTNYLMQNIFYTLIFSGFAANLYMAFTRNELYLIVIILWIIQVTFSVWWLKRFEMGPLEWVWRTLTYWKIPRLRKIKNNETGA